MHLWLVWRGKSIQWGMPKVRQHHWLKNRYQVIGGEAFTCTPNETLEHSRNIRRTLGKHFACSCTIGQERFGLSEVSLIVSVPIQGNALCNKKLLRCHQCLW